MPKKSAAAGIRKVKAKPKKQFVVVSPHTKAVDSLLIRLRNIITKIKKSTTVLAPALALQLAQDRIDSSVKKIRDCALVLDNATRWNSSLRMIRSFVPQQKAVNAVLRSESHADKTFTTSEITTLTELVTVLEPMEEATQQLEAGKTVTISQCYGLAYWLVGMFNGSGTAVHDLTKLTCPHVQHVRRQILAQLLKRFIIPHPDHHAFDTYAMATMLDPRTKYAESVPLTTHAKMRLVLERKYGEALATKDAQPQSQVVRSAQKASAIQKAFGAVAPPKVVDSTDTEIAQYLKTDRLAIDNCPLKWWEANAVHYPILKDLARKYLGIPASSASSERMWSIGGLLATKHRNRLSAENICHMIFLKHNLKVMSQLGLSYSKAAVAKGVAEDPNAEYVENSQ